ncbi:hypothetical protein PHYSODRAFT_485111 [Phytophthora sojae]|uniref:Anaphase-promoting complex subunit 4 WD40 domain-containing protein n=1 Tax=Phytophthora sojae (strain P6497) TaxID=1094619 RepID=G4YV59_PHYSP|nr:hypothetical protein PHYSODRAFT_485111 [Phytophthora sojae]EGZ24358.1 hypothetical protein PHYSODRAFT_485111 [Phytophthora sojae]|eukprot:XP_009519646.1 hypothetical protein PHYSODRAFT_485111 [Phytophthora sojae]
MIEQHRKHKAEVMAIAVSDTLDANFVVAGDRQGRISAWERDAYLTVFLMTIGDCRGKVSMFMPVSGDGIHSMAISPHDKALVAVGYRSGVLCLVDAAKGTVRHRLAGHDQEVQCVAWKATLKVNNPVEGDEEDVGEPDKAGRDVWLASSSRDKTIKVWKLASTSAEEPALDQVLRLPTGKQGMSFTQTKQLWLSVAWSVNDNALARHCLWSGSFDGSLLRWEWSADKSEDQGKKGKKRTPCKPVAVKGGHNRMLFSIVMVPPRSTALPQDDAVSMLTVSLDRELRLWQENPPSKSSPAATYVEKLTGLGGHAYSVSHNVATGLVAAGVGDQTIRLWNLGTDGASTTSDYQCELLWKGLQSKVTCVRWHPFQHSLLAYSMEDGRIGVYDTQTNKYSHFRTSHDHEVEQLQWIVQQSKASESADDGDSSFLDSMKQLEAAQAQGQSLEEALTSQEKQTSKGRDGDEVRVFLWSRDAGGHLLESNADAIDQKSREVVSGCVAFEWDEHCELLAIGRSNGVVEVLKWEGSFDTSSAIHRFHEHLEGVTCLAWGSGGHAGLLASGGEDGKIFVYGCGDETNALDDLGTSAEPGLGNQILGSIAAHSNKIMGLRWCPDVAQGRLASCSSDGTVQVWETASFRREAHFSHHVGRVLSLEWVSPFVLVTGGEDQTLRLWDCREQPKDPLSKQKKPSKVKQPQEVETIQEFFATEVKRFRDDREWENLANMLLLQGNIAEALRVVAKEGALSPTYLSYAPMAGMDVWREMTNLYAHQLDAQGDKKAAALHFLSIAKVRSAVACLVSGDAYQEAIALVRSRLGPHDPLLYGTLWKYSQFLSKRGRHGEAALALLNIGSVKATTRAVHMLVNTGEMVSIKAALDVLLAAAKSPAKIRHQGEGSEKGGEELSFPASFFISIAGKALAKSRFDIAETVASLLQSPLVGASFSPVHRLTCCLLGIVKTLDEHRQFHCKLENDGTQVGNRADHFYSQILSVCQGSGYWFDAEGETRVQEAQDLLVETNCFNDIEKAVAAASERPGSATSVLLQVSQRLLRFTIDVMSGSFIGGLEHMREAFLLLAQCEDSTGSLRLEVMTLLYPCGFASPKSLPQCGELADEQGDTLVLWSSSLLSQCRVVLSTSTTTAKTNTTEGLMPSPESLIVSLLHLLRGSFLDDNNVLMCEGLKDVGNQSQLQTLLNEMLVAAQLLQEEPAKQDEESKHCVSRKQALIDKVKEMRSSLTWSSDEGVE